MAKQYCSLTLLLASTAVLALGADPAWAGTVGYVSMTGSNSNACDTVTAPCLTLQAALNKTSAGGEIVVLGAGSYGPLSINKSISIVNDGAGVADIQQTTAGGSAITINSATAVVHLRGLSLDGGGVAKLGVAVLAASSLTMVNCVARRFTLAGASIRALNLVNVAIIDSTLDDNARGVNITATAPGRFRGLLSNTKATGNSQYGVAAAGPADLTIVGGAFSKNGSGAAGAGIYALNGASIMARDTVASNNTASGFFASGSGATIRVAHSLAAGNVTGFRVASGGLGETYGDNNLQGNTNALSGNVVTVAQQ